MIAVIRIRGLVNIRGKATDTLNRLRLRRKYACVLIDENDKDKAGMIKRVEDFVAYGEISKETQEKLINARGKKTAGGELKPFFRLHPPRGGLKSSKLHYPKGVLGNNKDDINKLIERML